MPVVRQWLAKVWFGHTREEEEELQALEQGDEAEKAETKRLRESTGHKYGSA